MASGGRDDGEWRWPGKRRPPVSVENDASDLPVNEGLLGETPTRNRGRAWCLTSVFPPDRGGGVSSRPLCLGPAPDHPPDLSPLFLLPVPTSYVPPPQSLLVPSIRPSSYVRLPASLLLVPPLRSTRPPSPFAPLEGVRPRSPPFHPSRVLRGVDDLVPLWVEGGSFQVEPTPVCHPVSAVVPTLVYLRDATLDPRPLTGGESEEGAAQGWVRTTVLDR